MMCKRSARVILFLIPCVFLAGIAHKSHSQTPIDSDGAIPILQSDSDLKLKPGMNVLKINFKGVVRDLMVEFPQEMKKEDRYPVVFGFHGAGGPMEAYSSRFSLYVKKYQIIGISIQGTPTAGGKASWNNAPRGGSGMDVDDIGFIKYLVDYLDKTERADLKRVYATGGSSGGLLLYRMAKETDIFAAIAPTKCGMIVGAHEPAAYTKPLSIMQVIGNEDKSFHGSRKHVHMYSAEERIEIWCKTLECNPNPTVNKDIEGMTVTTYVNDNGQEFVYVMLHGIGHKVPYDIKLKTDGMIMDFFMKHKKP